MSKQQIKQMIEQRASGNDLIETGVKGVRLFRVTEPIACAPVVYEPSVVAILGGKKEAILDGRRHVYGSDKYMFCTMSLPIEAGTPHASEDDPLVGVYISLDLKVMTELSLAMENTTKAIRKPSSSSIPQGLKLARWDDAFTDALFRILQLGDSPEDMAILGESRLRELYYSLLKGDASDSARRAFGVGNEIARTIEYLTKHLDESINIEDMAAQVGMSRAVFHRKFKQATTMSPIQFVKSLRLNNAATRIAGGASVNEAAMEVGYVSTSQFNREFKRMYGEPPKQWAHSMQAPSNLILKMTAF